MNELVGVSNGGFRAGALPEAQNNGPGTASGESFGAMLSTSLDRVSRLQSEADRAVEDLTAGRQGDLHNTMIAVEKAGIAMELVIQVRNKLLNAYETIMRQQI